MQMTDRELEEIIQTGRHVEVVVMNELDYRGAVVAFSQNGIQVATGDWYIRGVAEVRLA